MTAEFLGSVWRISFFLQAYLYNFISRIDELRYKCFSSCSCPEMYHSYPNTRQEFLTNLLYEKLKLNVFSVDIPLKN
jgi:hypothetical protein